MQSVAAVGQVRDAQVLARGEQVLHALWNKRPEWNLERQRGDVDVVLPARAGVQVDAVEADADAVVELLGGFGVLSGSLAGVDADVVFRDGESRADPA
jgi:hypothetical protein